MLVCPFCQAQQLDGTIFCTVCGGGMSDSGTPETTRSLEVPAPRRVAAATGTTEPGMNGGIPIDLFVFASRRRIRVVVDDEVLVGRSDSAKGIFPDVDLGPDGGFESGVSRRHAILAIRHGRMTIEDLGSSNGTFINGRQIAPSAVEPLRSNDEVQFGTLRVRIAIESTSG
ncbi:MAG TPA: FHA domain-containing protein [Roseiflexaceae bacterium]|nr:FHA domain-containing protein [Roseiflexaceae bacterium]HMP41175.1 FHA domain-containing protein [Roseiflexaceae bacterium]